MMEIMKTKERDVHLLLVISGSALRRVSLTTQKAMLHNWNKTGFSLFPSLFIGSRIKTPTCSSGQQDLSVVEVQNLLEQHREEIYKEENRRLTYYEYPCKTPMIHSFLNLLLHHQRIPPSVYMKCKMAKRFGKETTDIE